MIKTLTIELEVTVNEFHGNLIIPLKLTSLEMLFMAKTLRRTAEDLIKKAEASGVSEESVLEESLYRQKIVDDNAPYG